MNLFIIITSMKILSLNTVKQVQGLNLAGPGSGPGVVLSLPYARDFSLEVADCVQFRA